MQPILVSLNVNDRRYDRAVLPATTLLEFIRDHLGLTGTKCGCDTGECGICTVLVDGKPTLSCLLLAGNVGESKVLTVEGVLGSSSHDRVDNARSILPLHPIQEALVEQGAIQCGYCTPAMVLNGVAFLEKVKKQGSLPGPDQIKRAISGTICRCTGYTKIEKAFLAAAKSVLKRSGLDGPSDGTPPEVAMESRQSIEGFLHIGKPIPLLSAVDKVSGKAKYTADLKLTEPLIVKLLRSPHPSARIVSIDTKGAKNLSGVKAVLTGADFERSFGVLPISRDEAPLAKNVVRYVGEPVAAVGAIDERTANQALLAIVVVYDRQEPCLKAEQALEPTDNPIHPELKKTTNLHKSVEQTFGDPDRGFVEADLVVEHDFTFPSLSHAFTEPHAVQVEIDGRGDLTVYSSTQVPHYLHRSIAEVLAIPMDRFRVIKPHLGGGFGGKSDPFAHEIVAVKFALVTGRNIRLVLDRDEVFYTHHGRHGTSLSMKLGVHKDKGITALSARMLIDGGAYGSFGVVTSYYNGVLLQGPYKIANFSFHCDRVYTNKPMCGAMRGHGGVNPRFASEVLLDMACHDLKLDPCAFRLGQFLEPNSRTANEFRITSVGIAEGLNQAMARSAWKEKHRKLPFGKGIGVACGFFISGSALPIHWNEMPQSTVRMTIDYDGGVTLYSGASDIGQGSDTMLAQMAGEVLGLPLSMIRVISADTRLCPIDYGSYSSRVTFMAGNAARNAAIRMRKLLVKAACALLEHPLPEDRSSVETVDYFRQGGRRPKFEESYLGPNPDYRDGVRISEGRIQTGDGRSVGWLEVVRKALDHKGSLETSGVYISPKMGGSFKGSGAGLSPSYSFTVMISEIEVNPHTGRIRVERVTCAHDCGFALNPLAVEGQLEGSIHMGIGQALMEGIAYKNGATQNASFLEYKILSAHEMPEIILCYPNSGETEGPFGAKEVGEGALAPVVPSIANALFDAVGVRLFDLPLTPDKVLAALAQQKGEN